MNEVPHINRDSAPVPSPEEIEKRENKRIVDEAVKKLPSKAHELYNNLFSVGLDEFRKTTSDFNSLPEEERGKDQYDHDRPIEEHKPRNVELRTTSGYDFKVTLSAKGVISLTSLL